MAGIAPPFRRVPAINATFVFTDDQATFSWDLRLATCEVSKSYQQHHLNTRYQYIESILQASLSFLPFRMGTLPDLVQITADLDIAHHPRGVPAVRLYNLQQIAVTNLRWRMTLAVQGLADFGKVAGHTVRLLTLTTSM